MVNYELILYYNIGFRPKDVIRLWGYSSSSAYRFWRIFRQARNLVCNTITDTDSTSPERKKEVNHLDDLTR